MRTLRFVLLSVAAAAVLSGLFLRRSARSTSPSVLAATRAAAGPAAGTEPAESAAWKLEQEARRLEKEIVEQGRRADRDEAQASKAASMPTDTRVEAIRLRRQLADFAAGHGLAPARLNRLASLLVTGPDMAEFDAVQAEMSAAGVMDKGHPRSAEFEARLAKTSNTAVDKHREAIASVLDDRTMAELERHRVATLAHDQYHAFVVPAMNAAGIALSPAQADQFLEVLLVETPAAGRFFDNNGALRFDYPVASGVSDLQVAGQLPEAVLQKSAGFLSASQIEGIRRYAAVRKKLAELTPNVKPPTALK